MILTVTLNPAIDKRYTVQELRHGTVMRVGSCSSTAGGKGINVTKVLFLLGADYRACGVLGGFSGGFIAESLKQIGIKTDFTFVPNETRSCINIFDEKNAIQTELLEPGEPLAAADMARFMDDYKRLIKGADFVTMSGSALVGFPSDSYAELIRIAKAAGARAILDTSGELLKKGVEAKPFMIKPNADELFQLTGVTAEDDNTVVKAAKELYKGGIEIVTVSLGKRGSITACAEGVYFIAAPDVKVINTVGCGDAFTAGCAYAFDRGLPVAEALKIATAAASANAMDIRTGYFELENYEYLKEITTEVKYS